MTQYKIPNGFVEAKPFEPGACDGCAFGGTDSRCGPAPCTPVDRRMRGLSAEHVIFVRAKPKKSKESKRGHKVLAALVLGLMGVAAQACTLGLHIGSQHYPAQSYNNANPGAYYIASNGVTVGGYYNSERRPSFYAGYSWDYGPFRLQVGGITGYYKPVLPMVAPSVALGYGFRVAVLPKVERGGSTVVHLMYEVKL